MNPRSYPTLLALVALLLSILLAGCTLGVPAQPSCDELTLLQSQISRQASAEELRAWIAETYDIPPESITSDPVPQTQGYLLQWRKNDLWHNIDIKKGVVTAVGVDTSGFTASDAIACLGQPSHYSAMYGYETPGGPELSLRLLFPEHGVLAGGGRILWARPAQPPAITGDFPLNGMQFMRPGAADALLEEAHRAYTPALAQQLLDAYKPWPGDWKDVQITPFVSPP